MTEIRAKDKIFLAVAVPAAIVAAYWHCWRAPAGRRLAKLQYNHTRLVDVEDFADAKSRAERAFEEANAELEAERKAPVPQSAVCADAADSAAERERQVILLLRESGLTVVGSAGLSNAAGGADSRAGKGGELLKATGVRPSPIHRAYTVDGRYPDVVKALKTLAERKMAAIPDRVQMRAPGRNRWTLEVWL
jgi:hypothetical protein